MNTDFILQLVAYTIPALITAAIAYMSFNKLFEKQTRKDLYLLEQLKSQTTVDLQALKLQAFERLIILIERIDLKKLVLRVNPNSEDKTLYLLNLITHLDQEFDYNVSQQVYVSSELWQILVQTKNDITELIQITSANPNILDATQLRQALISQTTQIEQKLEVVRKAIKLEANTITE
ncbi:hypothetical protein HX017_03315 [Myroides marinus]|uniref:DUF7935 family protein n=1 Tax=Myroides marinus TaxID=703342 RepID=UPI000742382E|nr:hypothetical protein [Myroides marinus]KUF43471.1 hypothetical protein AS361_11180 [Myroides marinus]MDM1346101.1 hypothetical protein [Myroides marinus]MDM1353355.1 hypothetical protein [Myroides marinus]MDM1363981.1 hypothetical protein [Myroides marinus]